MATDMAHATTQERATLRKAFDVFDHSKTGVINPGDITGMLAHLGVDTDSELVADLWAVLDSDKDNKITFEEFAPVYVNWHRYGLRQEQKLMLKPEELQKVHAVFDRLDVSRSGWLSQAEMDAAFEQLLGTEEGAGLVDRHMVVRMFKHAGGDRHEMTLDAFKALYVQWFGYSGALYDADTANLGAAQGEHVPNASAAAAQVCGSRSQMATDAPNAARPSAIPRPMPAPPPVTTATRPVSRMSDGVMVMDFEISGPARIR